MTGDGGMMRGFDRRDGWLPGFDAVEEVTSVIVGNVQLDLLLIVRQLADSAPFDVGRVKFAAVDPDPTVGADPFGAHLNVRMSAGDGHRDILRVLEIDSIFCARI